MFTSHTTWKPILFLIGLIWMPGVLAESPPSPEVSKEMSMESRVEKNLPDVVDPRSAYVNNQFVPDERVELEDEPSQTLIEFLHNQMGHEVSDSNIDTDDDSLKAQRDLPKRPQFNVVADDDNYDSYDYDEDKPDASGGIEQSTEGRYQLSEMSKYSPPPIRTTTSWSSTTSTTTRARPYKRRTPSPTVGPKTTRPRVIVNQPKHTTITTTPPPPASSTTAVPVAIYKTKQSAGEHMKRHIVFQTISTGSQFVNSPIGDLLIKFSIGFAKPSVGENINELARSATINALKSVDRQKLKRSNKVQRE